ncbi:MAG TPA: hypothetical protein VFT27_13630 [Actinomycetota bacterium]|nr:hypothetical protein [Actinomycetota bacterium]
MPDLESRMPELLRRAAEGPPRDPELERRILRRARRRRVLTASAAGITAIALVGALAVGVKVFIPADRSTPGDRDPSPSGGTVTLETYLPDAIWPELTASALATAQAAADDGHQPWRLDPAQTAAAFAVNVFDWDPADVETTPARGSGGTVEVTISNRGLASSLLSPPQPAPETRVTLEQLGTQGETGVWTVTGVDSDLVELDPIPSGPTSPVFSGRLVDPIAEWSPGVWPVDATGIRPEGNHGFTRAAVGTFRVWTEIPSDLLAAMRPTTLAAIVGPWDPEGTIVGADAFTFQVTPETAQVPAGVSGATGATGPVAGPTGTTTVEVPPAVSTTRDAILAAASKLDYDALEALIDPDRFAYNFDDGSNPIPIWREDPTLLDPLVTILQMPFTTNREAYPDVDPSSPTVYIWPSLMGSDLKDLTAEDQAMLDTLGITERDVRDMQDAFGGYVGPRAGISEDGTWLWYVIGGD